MADGRRRGGLTTQRRSKAGSLDNIDLDSLEGIEAAIKTVGLGLARGEIPESRAKGLLSVFKLKLEVFDYRRLKERFDNLEARYE